MLGTIYEVHLICDECGRLVRRQRVDAATFERLAEEVSPLLREIDPEERAPWAEADRTEEEAERPVEVLVRHVAECGYCAERP